MLQHFNVLGLIFLDYIGKCIKRVAGKDDKKEKQQIKINVKNALVFLNFSIYVVIIYKNV